jgi:ketosteroid isomerase-like protein
MASHLPRAGTYGRPFARVVTTHGYGDRSSPDARRSYLACKRRALERKVVLDDPADPTEGDTMDVETLRAVCAGFNAHDLDAILRHFAEDATFDAPRGDEPYGQRHVGLAAIREAFAARFAGIPDVHYGDDRHFVSGDRGASEWLLTGTTSEGVPIEVRGCDLWEFRGTKISRKDSFWKIVG